MAVNGPQLYQPTALAVESQSLRITMAQPLTVGCRSGGCCLWSIGRCFPFLALCRVHFSILCLVSVAMVCRPPLFLRAPIRTYKLFAEQTVSDSMVVLSMWELWCAVVYPEHISMCFCGYSHHHNSMDPGCHWKI